jgi:general stress protein YciG
MEKTNKKKGFAAISLEARRDIARKGGRKAHQLGVAHQFSGSEAKIAGRKGGKANQAKNRKKYNFLGPS